MTRKAKSLQDINNALTVTLVAKMNKYDEILSKNCFFLMKLKQKQNKTKKAGLSIGCYRIYRIRPL